MPIRFRCGYCNRLLGIARRKAGSNTTCPHCGATIAVPTPEQPEPEGDDEGQPDLADIDVLLKADRPVTTAPAPSRPATEISAPTPAPTSTPAPAPSRSPPAPKPLPAVEPLPLPEAEKPLFERDVETVLAQDSAPPDRAQERKPKPAATSGPDAMSLDPEPGHYVLSSQKVTALAVAVVVLLGLAFAAGYFVGSR
jgi:hypothetical protein